MVATEELVDRAKAGDDIAIAALVERYQRAAVTTAWAITSDFHLAQDVVQEAFVEAFRQLPQLRRPSAFGAWLLAAVRRRATRAKSQEKEIKGLSASEMVCAKDDWAIEFREVVALLARLPEQERDVISLRYMSDFSVKEIANELDRPIGTVTKQLSRAIRRLQEMVAEVKR